jgi:hypothetical protein
MVKQNTNNKRIEHWREHVKSWEKLDISQAEYCRRHELNPVSFSYWKRKLQNTSNSESKFIKLDQKLFNKKVENSTHKSNFTYRLIIPGGYIIEIGQNFNPNSLKVLIRTLQGINHG